MSLLSRIALALAALSVLGHAGEAGQRYGVWTSGAIGGGGYLQQVVWAPGSPQRLYLASDVGGCFRSDDGGATWRMLHGTLPAGGAYEVRGILADPRDRETVMIATSAGIWSSHDAGATWTRSLQAWFAGNGEFRWTGRVLVRHPQQPDLLLAAAPGVGVFRSQDGGATWTATGGTGCWPTDLAIDRADPGRIWMCAQARTAVTIAGRSQDLAAGLWESRDGGSTWNRIAAQAPTELLQDPRDPAVWYGLDPKQQVLRSDDGLRSWTPFASGLPAKAGWARDDGIYDAIAAAGEDVILAGHGAHLYRLDRAAATWRAITQERVDEGGWWGARERHGYQHFGSALGFLGVDPTDPAHWLVTDWYAIYQSRDAGRSWRLRLDGIEMTVAHCLLQDPADPGLAHLGLADIGYLRSTDRGATWAGMRPGISNNIKHLAACPSRPGRLWAVGPQRWEWHANQVFSSDDGGLSWRRAAMRGLPDMANARCNSIAADPADPRAAWIALDGAVAPGAGGIWRTSDDGDSWTWIGQGLPTVPALFRSDIWVLGPELAAGADGTLLAAANDRNRTFRRAAGETTWRELDTRAMGGRPNAMVADPCTPGRFYACRREGGLWSSDDAGLRWRRILARDVWSMAVDAADPRRLVANGADGIWLSRDAGATWQALPPGLPYRHVRNVVAWAADRILVATGGNGVFHIDADSTGGSPAPQGEVMLAGGLLETGPGSR